MAAHSRRQSSSWRTATATQLAVGRARVQPVRAQAGAVVADPVRVGAGGRGLHQLAGDVGRQRLDLAEVDVVALAGALTPFERGDDREGAHRGGHRVGDRGPDQRSADRPARPVR